MWPDAKGNADTSLWDGMVVKMSALSQYHESSSVLRINDDSSASCFAQLTLTDNTLHRAVVLQIVDADATTSVIPLGGIVYLPCIIDTDEIFKTGSVSLPKATSWQQVAAYNPTAQATWYPDTTMKVLWVRMNSSNTALQLCR